MADNLYKHNSIRVNMFKPDSTYDEVYNKTKKLIKRLSIDSSTLEYCDIIYEKIARRTAGILHMFEETYNMTRRQVEETYQLNDLRKMFACKGIDLLEIQSYFTSNDNLLADENEHPITTQDNVIIKIIL